jgi:hypothetical protein
VYRYDAGRRITVTADGKQAVKHCLDLTTYNLDLRLKQAAERFQIKNHTWSHLRPRSIEAQEHWILSEIADGRTPHSHPQRTSHAPDWEPAIRSLWQKGHLNSGCLELSSDGHAHVSRSRILWPDGLPTPLPPTVRVGPIATGNDLQARDGVFDDLELSQALILGLDMEASDIGMVAHLGNIPYLFIAKGVMDFAEAQRERGYFDYAARSAAEVTIAFLLANLPPRRNATGPTAGVPAAEASGPRLSSSTAPMISAGRLPMTAANVVGREQEVLELDKAWRTPGTNCLIVVAWAGVGKSALINYWMHNISPTYGGADKVFAWSFYRQGTSDRTISADLFIETALEWFGDPDPLKGSAWARGERLARLIQRQRTLLVLDGVEALQFPPGREEGRLRDQSMIALLRDLAAHNNGLCVISTRLMIDDLSDFQGTSVHRMDLGRLLPLDGARLLRSKGIRGSDLDLTEASQSFDGHCLALTLLASYLNDAYGGDIRQRDRILALTDDVRYGGHAKRVLGSYEKWLGDGPELELLRLLGLFVQPAEQAALQALRSPPVPGLTDLLATPHAQEWNSVVARLERAGLLSVRDDCLDTHPLIREFFAESLYRANANAWKAGHNRLFSYFASCATDRPDSISAMQPLFRAVAHGCRAGRYAEAFREIYEPRIMRGDECYAANHLGARATVLSILWFFFEHGNWGHPVGPDYYGRQGLTEEEQVVVLAHVGLFSTALKGYAAEEALAAYARLAGC